MRLRLEPVEFKLCQTKECLNSETAVRYEGEQCPVCKVAFNASATPKESYARLILVGDDIEIYTREERLRCQNNLVDANGIEYKCNNLYSAPCCPLCKEKPRIMRSTIVWVRTFSHKESYEDVKEKEKNSLKNDDLTLSSEESIDTHDES